MQRLAITLCAFLALSAALPLPPAAPTSDVSDEQLLGAFDTLDKPGEDAGLQVLLSSESTAEAPHTPKDNPAEKAKPAPAAGNVEATPVTLADATLDKEMLSAYNGKTGYYDSTASEESCVSLNHCSQHGICIEGQCVCDMGWTGDKCNVEVKSCPLECAGHGLCDNLTGKCFCNLGWTGTGCNNVDETVAKKSAMESASATDRESKESKLSTLVLAAAVPDNSTQLVENMTEAEYDPTEDDPNCNCSSHGFCMEGRCVCDPGYEGATCELHAAVLKPKTQHTAAEGKGCPKDCNGRGKCNMFGSCECNDGFTGRDCGIDILGVTTLIQATEGASSAANGCSVHGLFIGGTCLCDLGYSGDDCSTQSSSGSARGSSDKAYWKQAVKQVFVAKKTSASTASMANGFPRFDNVFGAGQQQGAMQPPMWL